MRTGQPAISVVVPSYKGSSTLSRCVRSILDQTLKEPYEVVLVDSSPDGTVDLVATEFPEVRLIRVAQRAFPGAARNIGLSHATAEFIAFTDQDCVVEPEWLEKLLARLREGSVAAVGGAILNGTPASAVGTAGYLIEFNEFTTHRKPGLVSNLPHCNIGFRRESLLKHGSFPPVVPGAEDLIYNWFLRFRQQDLLFDPEIQVTHLNRTRLKEFLFHQHLLGRGSGVARRRTALPGQAFARWPILTPALPAIRIARTAFRLMRRDPRSFVQYLALMPICLPGYLMWTVGFFRGARDGRIVLDPARAGIA